MLVIIGYFWGQKKDKHEFAIDVWICSLHSVALLSGYPHICDELIVQLILPRI